MDEDIVVGISRKSTQEVLDNLNSRAKFEKLPNTLWYTPQVDFCFYAPAQEACAQSRERLKKLKLHDDELDLLASAIKPENVVEKLQEIQTHLEGKLSRKSATMKKLSKFVISFCTFAEKTSGVVNLLLPQSPEYTVTFGMLFILFKAVVTRKDREDSLTTYIESISTQLPLAEFYKTVFPTNSMKACVARIYSHIMKLLDEALIYYRSWRLGKLVDAVLQPASKFDVHITKINGELKVLNELKDAGHIAQTADMMEIVSGTGVVIQKLYRNFESQASAIGTSMDIINTKLDNLTLQTGQFLRFEMIKNARALQEVLLPGGRDTEEEFELVLSHSPQLSQKDHWENNGVLEDLLDWSHNGHDQLLWVGGSSGSRDSWVTGLSTDLVLALQPRRVTLLFLFCTEFDGEPLTPRRLVHHLIVQLLDLHPELAYGHPELCNTWHFKASVTFKQVWRIFRQLASRVPGLFIVIDRVEQCEADGQEDLVHQLLPAIIDLAYQVPETSVIVTSVYDPPDEVDELPMYRCYIDTAKRVGKR
ncbi:hypothetical protein GQ53DRAFT_753005 [Thozetella sp. PMI_491]|nr:hypothetical protein GQ53DRAFT_753005 [Thozetella sp. PMI_491]